MNYTFLSSFNRIMDNATRYVGTLSDKRQKELKEQLEHGSAQLINKEQLKMYLHSYGDIHRKKLLKAFEHIPLKVWNEGKISIFDYGAGLGLAEIVLSDFIRMNNVDLHIVNDVTLIEPSEVSLVHAVKYVHDMFNDSTIIPILKQDYEITSDDIQPKSQTVIHILSNVIDLPEFSGDRILSHLNEDNEHNNIVICVSPYYSEESRGKRLKEFENKLRGYRCIYKFHKHRDEWAENFSCQICIFESLYY